MRVSMNSKTEKTSKFHESNGVKHHTLTQSISKLWACNTQVCGSEKHNTRVWEQNIHSSVCLRPAAYFGLAVCATNRNRSRSELGIIPSSRERHRNSEWFPETEFTLKAPGNICFRGTTETHLDRTCLAKPERNTLIYSTANTLTSRYTARQVE